jgi:hypothetical protein
VKFGIDFHVMLLITCEFRKNECSEAYTLLTGINKILTISSKV